MGKHDRPYSRVNESVFRAWLCSASAPGAIAGLAPGKRLPWLDMVCDYIEIRVDFKRHLQPGAADYPQRSLANLRHALSSANMVRMPRKKAHAASLANCRRHLLERHFALAARAAAAGHDASYILCYAPRDGAEGLRTVDFIGGQMHAYRQYHAFVVALDRAVHIPHGAGFRGDIHDRCMAWVHEAHKALPGAPPERPARGHEIRNWAELGRELG